MSDSGDGSTTYPDFPEEPTAGEVAFTGDHPEPLPNDVVERASDGDPEAEQQVRDGWERAGSMEGEAPTG